jgi:hypothetical protein
LQLGREATLCQLNIRRQLQQCPGKETKVNNLLQNIRIEGATAEQLEEHGVPFFNSVSFKLELR